MIPAGAGITRTPSARSKSSGDYPAGAGITSSSFQAAASRWDHPRGCGDHDQQGNGHQKQ
jgi:hypothetical protein